MAVIGSLSVKLGLVTVEWDKATDKAKQQAKGLQGAFNDLGKNLQGLSKTFNALGGSLGLSLIGFTALTKSTLSYANEIKDLSEGFDISIGKTLQFRRAIEVSGGSAEGASRMLSTLFSKLSDAQKGTTAAVKAFEDIGVSFEELQKLSPEQAINRTFEALAKGAGDNTFKRIEAIKDLLGKKGVQLNVKDVSMLVSQSTAEFEKHAESLKKLGEVNDNLKVTMENLKIAIADMIAPFANKDFLITVNSFKAAVAGIVTAQIIGWTMEFYSIWKKIIEVWKEGAKVQALITALSGAKGVLMVGGGLAAYELVKHRLDSQDQKMSEVAQQPNNYGSVNNSLGGNIGPNFNTAGGSDGKQAPSVIALREQIKLTKEMMQLNQDQSKIKIASEWHDEYGIKLKQAQLEKEKEILKAKDEYVKYEASERHTVNELAAAKELMAAKITAATRKELDARQQITNELTRELYLLTMQDQLKKDTAQLDMASYSLQQQRSIMSDYQFNVENEKLSLAKKILALQEKMGELKNPGSDQESINHYNALKKSIQDEMDVEQELSDNRVRWYAIEEANRQSWSYGWNQSAMQYERDLTDASKRGAEAFSIVTNSMSQALDEFVRTGKISFKSLIGDMIKELLRLEMKAQASKIFGFIKGALGGFFDGAGGGVGGAGMFTGSTGAIGGSIHIGARAGGGDVASGMPYLVGEKGPELIVPKNNGTVIPNNSLSSMMGNQPQIVYNGPYIANMSAIDTQSSVQFLSKNKQAVWAANQSAQRSLPQSR
jgi:lambda family phage tail tape measure protein